MKWGSDDLADLAALWNAGKSAGAIAARLSARTGEEISRNAVIGAIGRLREHGAALRSAANSGNHRAAGAAKDARRRPPRPRVALPPPPRNAPSASASAPPDFPAESACRWLHGDIRDGTARWCAAPVEGPRGVLTARYCAFHAALVVREPYERSSRHGA